MGLKICTKHTATVAISWLLRLFKGPRGGSGSLWTHESTSTQPAKSMGAMGAGGSVENWEAPQTCWNVHTLAFAPFSEVEESAKVLQYLESEWLCVPWMSDILLQTSTSASAWDILPDTRAHQILSNVSQRIQWPWVQCLKMPGKKFVCPWVWKRSLADLGSLNMKTQLSCGPLQWNQSVSMYSRVLTVFTISQFKADQ